MFGYVNVNTMELKVKEYVTYRSYYCGLCQVLQQNNGLPARMTLSYDMTFLTILLTGLYEPECRVYEKRCIAHPMHKQKICINRLTRYCADMNVLLNYNKLLDDWQDERRADRYAYALLLKKNVKKIQRKYPKKAKIVQKKLKELSKIESENVQDLDTAAGIFGEITAEIFAYRKDEWEPSLRQMGFYLGKFIYLMDAYDDLEKDKKNGSYNPFRMLDGDEQFKEKAREVLMMMAAECAKAFERLPIIKEVAILRNILYSGIWTRFEKKDLDRKKRGKERLGV